MTVDLIQQQIEYYQARAGEYDEWFLRQGRYDRGEEQNRLWFAEITELRQALAAFNPAGTVLELACGTGLWTQQLVETAHMVTAVDAVAEVIALNRQRVQSANVHYLQADLFEWQPAEKFDVVFFSFWLSHVPPARFDGFWHQLRRCLQPDGRVFFIDSRFTHISTATDHRLRQESDTVITRRLNDGREYDIVKVFYDPAQLAGRVKVLNWGITVDSTANFFLYGRGQPQ